MVIYFQHVTLMLNVLKESEDKYACISYSGSVDCIDSGSGNKSSQLAIVLVVRKDMTVTWTLVTNTHDMPKVSCAESGALASWKVLRIECHLSKEITTQRAPLQATRVLSY